MQLLNGPWLIVLAMVCVIMQVPVSALAAIKPKILVLGGTGFVGYNFIEQATRKGYDVVSLSRRGEPKAASPVTESVQWVKGDAVDKDTMQKTFKAYGPFDACVHAIGLLFDSESGLKGFNPAVSGSGSIPDDSATYDRITRVTAFNAIDCLQKQRPKRGSDKAVFVFVSAAEAGWDFKAPVNFLERYLVAKRAVEGKLLDPPTANKFRSVVFRPSLIWTPQKPAALLSVVPFFVASTIGVPFVDRPVRVDALTGAMLKSIEDSTVNGVQRFKEIDTLSKDRA